MGSNRELESASLATGWLAATLFLQVANREILWHSCNVKTDPPTSGSSSSFQTAPLASVIWSIVLFWTVFTPQMLRSAAFNLDNTVLMPDIGLVTFPSASVGSSLPGSTASSHGSVDIQVNLGGTPTASQQLAFSNAEAFWESVLVGYQPGITLAGVTIHSEVKPIDGPGGILGQAGPTHGTVQQGYVLATQGIMSFDSADLATLEGLGILEDVIRHEMAHTLGFGVLWDLDFLGANNNASIDGTGRYIGLNGLEMYRLEFDQPFASFIPVEQGGGAGTADGHWDEVNGGISATGITDSLGRDMQFELMTGWLNAPTFVSNTSIASFEDIGFLSYLSHSVPENGATFSLFLVGLFGTYAMARSRKPTRAGLN